MRFRCGPPVHVDTGVHGFSGQYRLYNLFVVMAAAVAVMVAAAFAVLVVVMTIALAVLGVVMAAALVAFAVMVATAATALLLRQVFAVEAFLKLFLCSVANGKNLALEVEGLAGHGMVEIHGNGVFLNSYNLTVNNMA